MSLNRQRRGCPRRLGNLPREGPGSYRLAEYTLLVHPSTLCMVRRGEFDITEWNKPGYEAVYVYLACLGDNLVPQVGRVPFDVDIVECIRAILPRGPYCRVSMPEGEYSREWEREMWPIKTLPQAETRVNTWARELLAASRLPRSFWARTLPRGIFNDQACGLIIFTEIAMAVGYDEDVIVRIMSDFVSGAKRLKHLSDRMKMLGLAASATARLIIEINTLLGRGVEVDGGSADLAKRTDMSEAEKYLANIPSLEKLKDAIRSIYREELRCKVKVDRQRHLRDRAIWAKAGGHSSKWSRWSNNVRKCPFGSCNRAQYLSSISVEEIMSSVPEVTITQLPKLEHAKTRWIYSCDSISYAITDCLLSRVEASWRNISALLNPDIGGPAVEAGLCPLWPHVCVMLDYSDFNSQHRIEYMQAVFDVLAEFCDDEGADVCRWVSASLSNMNVAGQKWVAGLPSGHRATTFINTVLNAAYCRLCLRCKPQKSYHAGDDVLLVYDHAVSPDDFLFPEARFNPGKQSYGSRAEFLRKHHTGRASYGYPCRAIASLVSGSWVSDCIRENTDTLRPLVAGIDTIENRAGQLWCVSHLFEEQVSREHGLDRHMARAVVRRQFSWAGGLSRGVPLKRLEVTEHAGGGTPVPQCGRGVYDAVEARRALLSPQELRYARSLLFKRFETGVEHHRPMLRWKDLTYSLPRYEFIFKRERIPSLPAPPEDGFVAMVRVGCAKQRLLHDDQWCETEIDTTICCGRAGVCVAEAVRYAHTGRMVLIEPKILLYC